MDTKHHILMEPDSLYKYGNNHITLYTEITCAFISLPISKSSLTAGVWPFIAANMSGDIPSLLPVLKQK